MPCTIDFIASLSLSIYPSLSSFSLSRHLSIWLLEKVMENAWRYYWRMVLSIPWRTLADRQPEIWLLNTTHAWPFCTRLQGTQCLIFPDKTRR